MSKYYHAIRLMKALIMKTEQDIADSVQELEKQKKSLVALEKDTEKMRENVESLKDAILKLAGSE